MRKETEKANIRRACKKFIEENPTYSPVFFSLSDENKNWILDYLCGGKRVIPYEKIKTLEDLDVVPEGEFFSKTKFYSALKNEIIDDEDYENVKRFWRAICLKNLSELNDIYNFQNTIILCKIFENRVRKMTRRFPYNPQKCTLASSLSGCIHRFISKAIIALPTQTKIVELLEKPWLADSAVWIRDWPLTLAFCCQKTNKISQRRI